MSERKERVGSQSALEGGWFAEIKSDRWGIYAEDKT